MIDQILYTINHSLKKFNLNICNFLTSVNLFTLSNFNMILCNAHYLILNFHTLNSHFCSFEMSYTKLKYLSIYFTLCAGVVSHLLLFICWIKDPMKCFRNSATYLVTNLALADFMACTVGLIRINASQEFSTVFYISNTVQLASLFSMLSIAIDRYLLTVHPFNHRVLLNERRIYGAVLVALKYCAWISYFSNFFRASNIFSRVWNFFSRLTFFLAPEIFSRV